MMKILSVTAATVAALASPAFAAAPVPKGFLLYEKDAAKKDANPETSWAVSAKVTAKLVVNPCDRAALGRAGRTAAKTITYTAVPDYSKSEQIILFTGDEAAARAFADLKAAVRKCSKPDYRYATRAVALGDEGQAITGQSYQGGKPAIGGERAIVVRRANALVVYTQAGEWGKPAAADFARQTKDATRMLAKICTVAAC
ncbi:hypothetical protein ACIBG8_35850 [Nonomuraea sp. NPDC050556]|uniref:hypothetical protein n=1 Tax=Nonomuraea sp. NPDC050556 TaxID=3364369 RepID=UPI00378C341B